MEAPFPLLTGIRDALDDRFIICGVATPFD
jgi:hypothetical protein